MMAGRYAHAKQFRRHQPQLRILRSRLGRIIRDIRRKIEGRAALEEAFALPLSRATQIRSQQQRQRGWKLYSFHAPEVECIGKGKASAPYEFGVKASIVTNNRPAPGGQFVLHAKALPDNPYDGHTLRDVIDRTEALTGCAIERAYVDKGYRGHAVQNPRRVFVSGQKRGVFGTIKRELRRRSAIEPIIGHLKADGHLGRCFLKGRVGDAANVVLSAVGRCSPMFGGGRATQKQVPQTTSAASSPGSENSGVSSCSLYGTRFHVQPRSIPLLNGRPTKFPKHSKSGAFNSSLRTRLNWQTCQSILKQVYVIVQCSNSIKTSKTVEGILLAEILFRPACKHWALRLQK